MSGKNIQLLGDILTDRMKKSAGAAVPTTIELGIINDDMSLTVDSIQVPIPKEDYMVPLSFTHDTYKTSKESDGTGAPHDHRAPSVFRGLQPKDRVLVAWVGHQPLVVDIFVSSEIITSN